MKTIDLKNNLYKAGLSIEEVQTRYGLKKAYKMGSNENPLPLPEELIHFLKTKVYNIHRYPAYIRPVIKLASKYYNIDSDCLLLGNGSSELIDKLLQVYKEPEGAILISENTFPLYSICATARNWGIHKSKMEKGFKVSVHKMLSILDKQPNIKIIFISNPNNPTGSYISSSELELLAEQTKNKKVLLVLDEAYWGYPRAEDFPDSLHFMSSYSHVVVLRSMSKIAGLAGLRAGVMLAHPSIVNKVKKGICPFNVNILALELMQYIFSEDSFQSYLIKSRNLVWKSLDYFYEQMELMELSYYPSQGNFIFFEPGPRAFDYLLKKGLILRDFVEPELKSYLRMSVGLEEENHLAIQWIKKFLQMYKKEKM